MGVIKINPTELINIKRSMKASCDEIYRNYSGIMQGWNDLYEGVKKRSTINTSVGTYVKEFDGNIDYLISLVNELVAATGFTEDELLSGNYDEKFYEKKIYAYFFEKHYFHGAMTGNYKYLACFVPIDEHDETYLKYKHAKQIIDNNGDFFKKFAYEEFGFDEYDVAIELYYIKKNRGKQKMEDIMYALIHNCPDNYFEVSSKFNPTGISLYTDGYGFNSAKAGYYSANVDKIDINGKTFEFVQVLPWDYTNIEKLVYNFGKVNSINTMRALPSEFYAGYNYDEESFPGANKIVLACDMKAMLTKNGNEDYLGGKTYSYGDGNAAGLVCINLTFSLRENELSTVIALTHELAHRFYETNTTYPSGEWMILFEKYKDELAAFFKGYSASDYMNSFGGIDEFGADALAAYLLKGKELESICPALFKKIEALFEFGPYNDYYNEHINEVIYDY